MRRLLILLLAFALVACTGDGTVEETTTTQTSPSTPPTTRPTTEGCADPAAFTESGVVVEQSNPGSDARTIGLIGWESLPGSCERFTISFHSVEGAPATTPPSVRVEYLAGIPVVRMSLGVGDSVIVDQVVDSTFVSRLYVVTAINGDRFIDFHLRAPALTSVAMSEGPAEISVEFRPGIVDPLTGPAMDDHLVVLSPRDGATVSVPIPVTGYVREFDSRVLVLVTAGANVLQEQIATTAEGERGWLEYRLTLSLPRGPVLVFVGEDEPGRLNGVVIPVTVE